MGFSLQFAQLAAFFVALAAPIIFLAYLRQRNKQRKLVSSVLLLGQLRKNAIIRKKFRPPLNSLFELLALLFLVFALAQPFLLSKKNRVAIILDNSLSMNARSTSASASSRLEEAKIELASWLQQQSDSSTYTLFSSAPSLKMVSAENVAASDIESAFSSVSLSQTSDSLPVAAIDTAEGGNFEKILIVSDKELVFDEDEPSALVENSAKTTIESLKIGSPMSNYYIQTARLIRKPSAPGKRALMLTLGFSGQSKANIEATVLASNRSLPQSNQDFKPIVSKSIGVSPNRSQHLEIELPAKSRSARSFKVQISASATVENSLLDDDSAWVSSAKSTQFSVLVVAPRGISAKNLGLNRLSSFQFTVISPEEYARLRAPDFKNYGMVLFYQTAPVATPQISSLLVLPPAENSLFPVSRTIDSPRLSSWDTSHPILTYLRVPVLTPPTTQLFDVPVWARAVLNTEKGPAAVVAESRGIRFASIGFEVFPFEGKKSPAVSILLINTFRWLLGSERIGSGFKTGGSFEMKGDKTWVIASTQSPIETVDTTESNPRSHFFKSPGIYNITSISTDDATAVKKDSQTFAVNSFFPRESMTARNSFIETPEFIEHQDIDQESSTKLWWIALIAALLMLLIDFALRTMRSTSSAINRNEVAA